MHPGLILTYTVRPIARIPLAWVTEISHVVAQRLFVDEQRAGPYAFWHHQHHFRAVAGGVEMRDIVHYRLPFGPLGDVVNALSVASRVRGIFAFRKQVIGGIFPVHGNPSGGPASSFA